MPHVKIGDRLVHVPEFLREQEIRGLPVVRSEARPEDTVFLSRGRDFQIVERGKEYRLDDGVEVDWVSPSESGSEA